MMEWEKPYMEDSIDFLEPTGDVLEIGFGLGYSATQIMKHKPKSYTVIECDKKVIEKANEWVSEWDKKLPEVPVTIVEGTWQDMLQTVGKFDSIYFDDFPLGVWKADKMLSLCFMRRVSFLPLSFGISILTNARICSISTETLVISLALVWYSSNLL